MWRQIVIAFFVIFCGFLLRTSVRADYVLPYPSYLPGNRLYQISFFLDKLKALWYWGNIASSKYHLQLADKYLVEAKTLFEYKQYFLAVNALQRSDDHFQQVPKFISKASKEKKDVSQLQKLLEEAVKKHLEVLTVLANQLPYEFNWQPEKQSPQILRLSEILTKSIRLRKSFVNQ